MLHKITLCENGIFEIEEIKVLNTKTKSGAKSGTWKTANGNMKVSAFEKVNYELKSNSFVMHTTQEVEIAKQLVIGEAITTLQGFARGYKQQNKLERARVYQRTKKLKELSIRLEKLEIEL